MARAKARAGRTPRPSRGRGRARRGRQLSDEPADDVPDVFRDMLSEATPSDSNASPPPKKRRIGGAAPDAAPQSSSPVPEKQAQSLPKGRAQPSGAVDDGHGYNEDAPRLQTIIDDSESDDSDDMDWEDVDLNNTSAHPLLQPLSKDEAAETLQIEVASNDTREKPARARRKAATAAERAMRLDIHKMHLLCLLYSSHIRNAWCNDSKVQASLKRFLSNKIKTCFTPNPDQSQSQAVKNFNDGLTLAKEAWKSFKITSLGMRRAKWARDAEELQLFRIPENADPVMDVVDFRKAATAFEGSADCGAMLFCALLRAAGVDARLVCSLQPLPFAAGSQPPPESASKDQKNVIYAEDVEGAGKATSSPKSTPLKRITRIGRPGFSPAPSRQAMPPPAAKVKRTIPHPRYPVYWVEAFSAAQQKWVTVDPIATGTVGKPSRLEPPLSDPDVSLTYVVAFEDDGVAKDVTRRYAKAYNAKTRKFRVEISADGDRWWRKATKLFRRRTVLDRDQVEDAELSRREAQEEMPKGVQDFKDHQYYVLERHLKHNEVIHPKREVGKVNVGTAANTKLEPIFRRRDVHQLKSADKWYRLGREIKPGEQPLKHAKPRRNNNRVMLDVMEMEIDAAGGEEEEQLGAALYAPFQTELYVAPPCVRGRVPRNAFGNLDVYVPSMVPPGGAHVRHANARLAARLLGIDYADAVTGFSWKGRHGTAVVEGVVVAAEHRDAVEAVLEGIRDLEVEEEEGKRTREALRLWRKFLLGLRIVERVQAYASADERKEMEERERERARLIEEEEEEAERGARAEEMAGGFLLAEGADEAPAEPTVGRLFAAGREMEMEMDERGDDEEGYEGVGGLLPDGGAEDGGGGFMPEGDNQEGDDLFKSRIMETAPIRQRGSHGGFDGTAEDESMAGGFVPEEGGGFVPEEGGGFLPEEGGGGFIPDEGEEEGGFVSDSGDAMEVTTSRLPDDMDAEPEKNDRAAEAPDASMEHVEQTADEEHRPEAGEGGPATAETGDASRSTAAGTVESGPRGEPAQEDEKSSGASGGRLPEDAKVSRIQQSAPEAAAAAAESSDERDSLPSHDPEDDDAEPDWLAEEVVSD